MRLAVLAVLAVTWHVPASGNGEPIPRFVFVDGSERLARKIDCSSWSDRPGFALAVLHRGRLLLREDCGLASVERREAIGPRTRFDVGQISRTFVAAAVLQLFERGQLALDDPLSRHFPELPAWAQRVRVMHLLHHTSGLPDPADDSRSAERLDDAEVMRSLRRLREPSFEPGADYAVTRANDVLLAELIERVSGRRLAEYLEREIFRPLGLEHTALFDEPEPDVPHGAVGYRTGGRGSSRPGVVAAHAGFFSTVDDLRAWHRALTESLLLQPATTALMFHTPLTLSGKPSPVGMGWVDGSVTSAASRHRGLRAFSAVGAGTGFSAALTYYPDEELTFIVLANTGRLPDFLTDAHTEFLIHVPGRPR